MSAITSSKQQQNEKPPPPHNLFLIYIYIFPSMRITFVAAAVFFWGPTPVEEGMQIRRPRRLLLLLCRASSFISMCASYIYKHIHPEKKRKRSPRVVCVCFSVSAKRMITWAKRRRAHRSIDHPPKRNGKKCLFYFKSFFSWPCGGNVRRRETRCWSRCGKIYIFL